MEIIGARSGSFGEGMIWGDFDGRNEVGTGDLSLEIGGSWWFSSRRYYLRWSFSVGVALLLGWRCEGKTFPLSSCLAWVFFYHFMPVSAELTSPGHL